MTTDTPAEALPPPSYCGEDICGVNHLHTRLPTRLTIAIDAHAGYLDEIALTIVHAVLLELANWELIAKGVHFSIEYPPSYTPPGH